MKSRVRAEDKIRRSSTAGLQWKKFKIQTNCDSVSPKSGNAGLFKLFTAQMWSLHVFICEGFALVASLTSKLRSFKNSFCGVAAWHVS